MTASTRAADAPKVIDVKVIGHGEPVIFIPGLATPGAIWDDTVKHLQDKFECHVVTIAGFGGLPPVKTDHLLDDARDQIIAYARSAETQPTDNRGSQPRRHACAHDRRKGAGFAWQNHLGRRPAVSCGVMLPGVTDLEGAKKGAAAMMAQMHGADGGTGGRFSEKRFASSDGHEAG